MSKEDANNIEQPMVPGGDQSNSSYHRTHNIEDFRSVTMSRRELVTREYDRRMSMTLPRDIRVNITNDSVAVGTSQMETIEELEMDPLKFPKKAQYIPLWLLCWPWYFVFRITIPDCKKVNLQLNVK